MGEEARAALMASVCDSIKETGVVTITDLILAGLWTRGFKITELTRDDVEGDYKDRIAAMGSCTFDPGEIFEDSKGRPVMIGIGIHDSGKVTKIPVARLGRKPPDGAA